MKKSITPEPAIIVIFGITGDLVKRKLFPALYRLIKSELLHESTMIVGVTRQNIETQAMLEDLISDYSDYDEGAIDFLKKHFVVHTMDVNNGEDYELLNNQLDNIEESNGFCMNRILYLSIPPQVFTNIVAHLGNYGLNKSCKHDIAQTRLLVEKPFGYDLASAKQLIEETSKFYEEGQIFRIDHYLAKETAQNILSFRFSNAIFESLWDKNNISLIYIEATETIGIEGRAAFYEQVGALRDLIQSHLLQLAAIITMEEPTSFSSDDIHEAKLSLLNSIKRPDSSDIGTNTFRGQYATYRAEVNNQESNIETFAAVKLEIDNARWQGVPIIIKTGKALDQKKTIVKVVFQRHDDDERVTLHNSLSFRIQPNEGIDIELIVKKPGLDNELQVVDMDFSYNRFFESSSQPDAYERVLVDAIRGDHTLFSTSQEIIASWEIVDPIIKKWQESSENLHIYKNNSSGQRNTPEWLNEKNVA